MPEINSQNSAAKLPPQNIEAEQSVLGCLLIDKDAVIKVIDLVSDGDFYKDAHALIFAVMRDLYNRREPLDIVSVANRLADKNQLELVGGRSYLASLSNTATTSAHIVHYANIVQRKATLRRLINAASEVYELGFQEEEEVDKILDDAEKMILGVSQKFTKNAFSQIDSLLTDAFDRIDDLHKMSGKMRGVPTGYTELDKLLSGLQKSDLIILAARPSVGKTSFALDLARQVAVNSKQGVGIFSLEMSKEQLVDRMLCSQAGVSLWKMRTGRLSDQEDDDDFSRIGRGMGQLSEAPIYIDDNSTCTIMDIRTKARRLQVEKGLGLIIVDYLQLMEGRGKKQDNRVQEIAEITRGLKSIARELDVPLIALSQLSRSVEQTKPAIPRLAHLRDSGSIEQDADIVMFIYRKAADRGYRREELLEDEKHLAEIHIAKHRNGPTGVVNLYFNDDLVSFRNLENRNYDEPPMF